MQFLRFFGSQSAQGFKNRDHHAWFTLEHAPASPKNRPSTKRLKLIHSPVFGATQVEMALENLISFHIIPMFFCVLWQNHGSPMVLPIFVHQRPPNSWAQLSYAAHGLQLELLVHVAHVGAGLLRGAAREGQDLCLRAPVSPWRVKAPLPPGFQGG